MDSQRDTNAWNRERRKKASSLFPSSRLSVDDQVVRVCVCTDVCVIMRSSTDAVDLALKALSNPCSAISRSVAFCADAKIPRQGYKRLTRQTIAECKGAIEALIALRTNYEVMHEVSQRVRKGARWAGIYVLSKTLRIEIRRSIAIR